MPFPTPEITPAASQFFETPKKGKRENKTKTHLQKLGCTSSWQYIKQPDNKRQNLPRLAIAREGGEKKRGNGPPEEGLQKKMQLLDMVGGGWQNRCPSFLPVFTDGHDRASIVYRLVDLELILLCLLSSCYDLYIKQVLMITLNKSKRLLQSQHLSPQLAIEKKSRRVKKRLTIPVLAGT